MAQVTSQSRVDNRLVVETRVHMRKAWEPVKELYVVFATSLACGRVRPIDESDLLTLCYLA